MEEAALNGRDGEESSALGVGLGACVGSPWGGVSAPPSGCYSQGWESEFCSSF